MVRTPGLVVCVVLAACQTTADPSDGGAVGSSGEAAASSTGAVVTTLPDDDGAEAPGGSSSDTGASPTTGGSGSGCGVDPGITGAVVGQVEIEGQARRFTLVVPEGYDPSRTYPFVFMFHGRGSNGEQFRMYAGVEAAAGDNAILVYPDALPNANQGGQTGWDLSPNGIDVAFMDRLLEDFNANLCIDPERIFATGHSHGGFFSNAMGCARGQTLRAIAPVAGGGPGAGCEGSVAAWLAHNPDDQTVPIALGVVSRNHWIEANGCTETAAPTDPAPCVAYEGCDAGYDVVWCEHDEESQGIGAHGWPSFAGSAVWAFFAGY